MSNLILNIFSASIIFRLSTQTAEGKKWLAIQDEWYKMTDAPCAGLDLFVMRMDRYGEYGIIYPLYPELTSCTARPAVFDINKSMKQVIFHRYSTF